MISRMSEPMPQEEFTVDELAQRAGMTVRNVRAYASRGLIEPPRLAGRTGFYTIEHLSRLQLIRQLLGRGFTLAAVEDAILRSPATAPGHALELMSLLEAEVDGDQSITMSREELASLAKVRPDHDLFDTLVSEGLIEFLDEGQVRLVDPAVVRPGAAAISIGLSPESVAAAFPLLRDHLREIADFLVLRASSDIVQPFLDDGFPEDQWHSVLESIENLLPIASKVVLGIFRTQLREAIEIEVGDTLQALANSPGSDGATDTA